MYRVARGYTYILWEPFVPIRVLISNGYYNRNDCGTAADNRISPFRFKRFSSAIRTFFRQPRNLSTTTTNVFRLKITCDHVVLERRNIYTTTLILMLYNNVSFSL